MNEPARQEEEAALRAGVQADLAQRRQQMQEENAQFEEQLAEASRRQQEMEGAMDRDLAEAMALIDKESKSDATGATASGQSSQNKASARSRRSRLEGPSEDQVSDNPDLNDDSTEAQLTAYKEKQAARKKAEDKEARIATARKKGADLVAQFPAFTPPKSSLDEPRRKKAGKLDAFAKFMQEEEAQQRLKEERERKGAGKKRASGRVKQVL